MCRKKSMIPFWIRTEAFWIRTEAGAVSVLWAVCTGENRSPGPEKRGTGTLVHLWRTIGKEIKKSAELQNFFSNFC